MTPFAVALTVAGTVHHVIDAPHLDGGWVILAVAVLISLALILRRR